MGEVKFLMTQEIYKPIKEKIYSWIWYEENKLKSRYADDRMKHDEFRSKYDLDCVLTNGNLNADTIFSLWLPLRLTLVDINGYTTLNKNGLGSNRYVFLKNISIKNNLEYMLPSNYPTVIQLSKLFKLGQSRANVMILPENQRWLNSARGKEPFYDYIPYFLHECFSGGKFSVAFNSDEELKKWIQKESLEMLFDGIVAKNNIRDLSGSGDIRCGIPNDIEVLLKSYINILENRM